MSDSFLTDAEIADLTRPLTQGKARCRFLRDKYGVKVIAGPDGQPRVGRAEFNAAMMSQDRPAAPAPQHRTEGNVVKLDVVAMRNARNRPKQPA